MKVAPDVHSRRTIVRPFYDTGCREINYAFFIRIYAPRYFPRLLDVDGQCRDLINGYAASETT